MIKPNLLFFSLSAFRAFKIHRHGLSAYIFVSNIIHNTLCVLFPPLARSTKHEAIDMITTNLLSFSPSARRPSKCAVMFDLLQFLIQISSSTSNVLFSFLIFQKP